MPEDIRLPPGRLVLDVTSEDGSLLDFSLYVDGWLTHPEGGFLDLGGLTPGMHTVIVGARDHERRVLRVRIPGTGARKLALKLKRQAAAPPK
jgi:hypothetical protein